MSLLFLLEYRWSWRWFVYIICFTALFSPVSILCVCVCIFHLFCFIYFLCCCRWRSVQNKALYFFPTLNALFLCLVPFRSVRLEIVCMCAKYKGILKPHEHIKSEFLVLFLFMVEIILLAISTPFHSFIVLLRCCIGLSCYHHQFATRLPNSYHSYTPLHIFVPNIYIHFVMSALGFINSR